jgi:3-deoxy-7-phosphoheptulonate synthase
MHGNTQMHDNFKIRYVKDIVFELEKVVDILNINNFQLNGVHFECTYENVTECIGGICNKINFDDLPRNYTTYCDPRINLSQVK